MTFKHTQDFLNEFIEKANKIHKNRYNYDSVVLISSKEKIKIKCFEHGFWMQNLYSHLNGNGCPGCFGNSLYTLENFIKKAKEKHGDKFNYSTVIYINMHTKIIIKCSVHDLFQQTPADHLSSKTGCLKCGGTAQSTTKEFIEKAKIIHGDLYDYGLVNYINASTPVTIYCPKHGLFFQKPLKHLSKHGCPVCGKIKANLSKTKTLKEFIDEAIKKHGDNYDYSKVNYAGAHVKTILICNRCPGKREFLQTPHNHLINSGCIKHTNNISGASQRWLNSLGIPDDLNHREITIKIGKVKFRVDGFDPKTNTVYEFNGDYWHGNPEMHAGEDINSMNKISFGELFKKTIEREKLLKSAGYKVISIWSSDFKKQEK